MFGSFNHMNLQSTLSATSAAPESTYSPHHPCTCIGDLYYHEDDSLECNHVRTDPGDARTAVCVRHSIAILLFELLHERETGEKVGS